jgi:hypothetical protein
MFVHLDDFFVEKHISCRDSLGVFKSWKYWAMPFQLVVSVIAQIRQWDFRTASTAADFLVYVSYAVFGLYPLEVGSLSSWCSIVEMHRCVDLSHGFWERFDSIRIVRAWVIAKPPERSASPFCCGVLGAEGSVDILLKPPKWFPCVVSGLSKQPSHLVPWRFSRYST